MFFSIFSQAERSALVAVRSPVVAQPANNMAGKIHIEVIRGIACFPYCCISAQIDIGDSNVLAHAPSRGLRSPPPTLYNTPKGYMQPGPGSEEHMRGYSGNKDALGKRLARIEGQVRGIAAMIGNDRYCIDVVTQVQAARAALSKVEAELLRGHVSHCLDEAAASGDAETRAVKLEELMRVFPRMAQD